MVNTSSLSADTIIFNMGEETLPKIEGYDDYVKSPNKSPQLLFKEQYDASFEWVDAYLDKIKETQTNESVELSNILAYIGERGSGKTSCMLSIRRMLKEMPDKDRQIPLKSDKKFSVLDYIDPSFFDKKNNIVSIVIARLYLEFKERVKELPDVEKDCVRTLKHELLASFKKTTENIDLLLGAEGEYSEDALQRIDDLAAAVNLRESIKKLISQYLRFFGKDVLVIPVDDVDLHISEAYLMVEQIRKYLAHSQVIVLLAVKIDQLTQVVKQQLAKEFDTLLKMTPKPQAGENVLDIGVVDEMVERYLGKLIPLGQRIYLPEIEMIFGHKLKIKDGEKEIAFDSIREAVPAMIFEKARYLFYNSPVATSLIVPRNLRELRHLIHRLYKMRDYEPNGDNKTLFKRYFFESWTAGNLNTQDQEIVKNLLRISDATVFNKAVVLALEQRFELKRRFTQDSKKSEYDYIMGDDNAIFNISLGDAMALVRLIERTIYRPADTKLLFMIRSIYSMRLYEYYDEYTDNYNDDPSSEQQPQFTTSQKNEVKRQGLLPDVSNLEKLVGGGFINSNPEILYLLPNERNTNERTRRKINVAAIYHPKIVPLATKEEMLLAREFFALTTSRRYDTQDDNAYARYRSSGRAQGAYYRQEFGNAVNGLFDATCFFANLLNIKKCYERFDRNLYADALNSPNSILRRLISETKNRRNRRKEPNLTGIELGKRMLSWFSIRNIEILEDILDELGNVNYASGDSKRILASFFAEIGEYSINTYDDYSTDRHVVVDFEFAKILSDVVSKMNDDIFKQVYSAYDTNKAPERFSAEFILKNGIKTKSRLIGSTVRKRIRGCLGTDYVKYQEKIEASFVVKQYYTHVEIREKLYALETEINK